MIEDTKQQNAIVAAGMKIGAAGIEPANLAEAKLIAETFISSQLVPKSFDTPAKIIVAYQAGKEMGMGLWESLTKLYVVNGRVGMEAKSMKGKALNSGKCRKWTEEKIGVVGEESEGYRITVERTDGSSGSVEYTWRDAMDAGLVGKDTYKKFADDMLWNRATSKCCRRWFEDVIYGVYTPEELQAIPPDQAYEPVTPKRGERDVKPVASTVTDTPKNTRDEILQKIADALEKRILEKYGMQLTDEQAKRVFLEWADTLIDFADLLDENKNATIADNPLTWPAAFCEKYLAAVEDYLLPIPAQIEAIFKPQTEEEAKTIAGPTYDTPEAEIVDSASPDPATEPAAKKVEAKKAWLCEACGATFDKYKIVGKGKDSKRQCPECSDVNTVVVNK